MRFRSISIAAVAAVAVVAVIAAISLSACSGSKKHDSAASTHVSAPPTSSATNTQPDSPEAAAVRKVYTQFVDPKVPLASKAGMLQDGAAFQPSLEALSKTDYAKTVSLAITKVTVTSPKQATVTFDVLLSGSPVVRNQQGYAVNEGGTWKVAGATFCGLLAAQGPVPAVCKTSTATSLPG